MSAKLNAPAPDNLADIKRSGVVWYRLHSEREDICEALLKESTPGFAITETTQVSLLTTPRRLELLQARLCKIDNALDRLMSGCYGDCTKCGKWIEDTKLGLDPAIEFCLECWLRIQRGH